MRGWHLSPRLAIGLLVGLVALDVTLVAAALRPVHQSIGLPQAGPRPDPSSTGVTVPAPSPGDPLVVMLMASDTQRAWRIEAGSCAGGGATLRSTVDGGRSWVKRSASLSRIVRVQPTDRKAAFVIGAGSGCAAQVKETADDGLTWVGGGDVGLAWFRDPGKSTLVWAPGTVSSSPCGKRPVLDLAVISAESARVLCSDGLVRSTTRHGTSWTDVTTVEGAVALALSADPALTYVARVGAAGCPGVQVVSVQPATSPSCVKVTVPHDAGQVALSLVKGGGWLAVGATTMRSTDDLVSWQAS
jgi:hypothetical protein